MRRRKSLALTIARRELRGGLKGLRVFLACLALGVAAIAAVGTLRTGIQQGLTDQGAVILGGDTALHLAHERGDERHAESASALAAFAKALTAVAHGHDQVAAVPVCVDLQATPGPA